MLDPDGSQTIKKVNVRTRALILCWGKQRTLVSSPQSGFFISLPSSPLHHPHLYSQSSTSPDSGNGIKVQETGGPREVFTSRFSRRLTRVLTFDITHSRLRKREEKREKPEAKPKNRYLCLYGGNVLNVRQ